MASYIHEKNQTLKSHATVPLMCEFPQAVYNTVQYRLDIRLHKYGHTKAEHTHPQLNGLFIAVTREKTPSIDFPFFIFSTGNSTEFIMVATVTGHMYYVYARNYIHHLFFWVQLFRTVWSQFLYVEFN